MSTVLVVTPILITSWPAITAAVSAGVASLGFTVAQDAASQVGNLSSSIPRAEIEVEDSLQQPERIVRHVPADLEKFERGHLRKRASAG